MIQIVITRLNSPVFSTIVNPSNPIPCYYSTLLNAHYIIATITVYPSFFKAQSEETILLFPQIHSPQFNNIRPINLYTPWSMIENPIQRPVIILVVLDGNTSFINRLTQN